MRRVWMVVCVCAQVVRPVPRLRVWRCLHARACERSSAALWAWLGRRT
jgi:hypothetical protein